MIQAMLTKFMVTPKRSQSGFFGMLQPDCTARHLRRVAATMGSKAESFLGTGARRKYGVGKRKENTGSGFANDYTAWPRVSTASSEPLT